MNAADAHAPLTVLVALAYDGAKAVRTGFRAPTVILTTRKETTTDALFALLMRHHDA